MRCSPRLLAKRRLPSPATFTQMVVLSDGSAYEQQTTSPRATLRLTRDYRNHPLWNPNMSKSMQGAEEAGRMARFKERYGKIEY